MEIKEPKFREGQKVIDKKGNVSTVIKINSYHFEKNEYRYDVSYDGENLIKAESYLEPYPKNAWELQDGDECFFITAIGNVFYRTWDGSYCAFRNMEIGNVFLTEEEAEYELERRKIEVKMLRLGGRRNIKICYDNYYITYDHKTRNLAYLNRNWMHSQGIIFFDTYVDVDKAVKSIGEDRIKKYIFGVEE